MEYQNSKPESLDSNATRRKSDSPTNTNTTTSTNTKYTNMSPPPRPSRPSGFGNAHFNPCFHTFQPQPQKPHHPQQPPHFQYGTRLQTRRKQTFSAPPPPIQQKPVAPVAQLSRKADLTISEAEQERLHQLAKQLAKERTEQWVESLFEMHPNV
ncbi:hypothetical protein ONS95_007811 [Cadophora gregata]|uniref:uncharacterized protein n=1 Tax=Cadophora gregata TaxID=51156 RepID=UPI0026DAA921|nr:uncharacterized protein ONS95_007811 [Cadophora gregata]KAK0126194.1 hypothetical protein ONS95_007811 [Cadophora gregata]